MSKCNAVEPGLDRTRFAARSLMAPTYLGLAAAPGMLVIVFLREVTYCARQALSLNADQAAAGVPGRRPNRPHEYFNIQISEYIFSPLGEPLDWPRSQRGGGGRSPVPRTKGEQRCKSTR